MKLLMGPPINLNCIWERPPYRKYSAKPWEEGGRVRDTGKKCPHIENTWPSPAGGGCDIET